MNQFKTTYNILYKPDEDECFNESFNDAKTSSELKIKNWDYKRPLQVDDVDLWEVIYEASGGIGIYAAYKPYAEYYLLTTGFDFKNKPRQVNSFLYYHKLYETFYGRGSEEAVKNRARELGISLFESLKWVSNDDPRVAQQFGQKNTVYFL